MSRLIDLTDKKFGRLTVIQRGEDYVSPKGAVSVRWICECDCGNKILVSGGSLKSRSTVSCGCKRSETVFNSYKLEGESAYINVKDKVFIVDKRDIPLISNERWHISKNGYVVANRDKKYLHRVLMKPKTGEIIDHINGDKLDNRRENLRIVDYSENGYNRKLATDNKSGEFFITYSKSRNYYSVTIDGRYVGGSQSLDEAVRIRDEHLKDSKVAKYNRELQREEGQK